MDEKPEYAHFSGDYGDWEYDYLLRFCRQCGYEVIYDGDKDDFSDNTIHMGMDSDYDRKEEANLCLTRKLASLLFRDRESKKSVIEQNSLSIKENEDKVSADFTIHLWIKKILNQAFEFESRMWSK